MDRITEITNAVINSTDKVILLDGGVGNGKSTIAQRKIHYYLKNSPHKVAIMVHSHYHDIYLMRYANVVEKLCGDEGVIQNKLNPHIQYQNGSRLYIYNRYDFLKSVFRAGLVFLEDADTLPVDVYEEAIRRHGQVILACNPPMIDDPTQHWIYKRLIQTNLADRYHWSVLEAAGFYDDIYYNRLFNTSEKQRIRHYEGSWQTING